MAMPSVVAVDDPPALACLQKILRRVGRTTNPTAAPRSGGAIPQRESRDTTVNCWRFPYLV